MTPPGGGSPPDARLVMTLVAAYLVRCSQWEEALRLGEVGGSERRLVAGRREADLAEARAAAVVVDLEGEGMHRQEEEEEEEMGGGLPLRGSLKN